MAYKTVQAGGMGAIEIKKSRFIANTHPISSEEEAQAFLGEMRKKYWDARHNCYAYTLGSRFELQRSSDDGEPPGTAGRPILEFLLKEEIHNCIIVVTRYFGGTLLGTGGLIRAYQEAARDGIAHSTLIERRAGRRFTVRTDYSCLGRVQTLTAQAHFPVTDSRYADVVEMDVIVPEEQVPDFLDQVREATAGAAQITPLGAVEYADAAGEVILFDKGGDS